MSLKIDLAKGTVKQDIAELPEKMLDFAFEVLMDRARLMQGIAQTTCPVDTGSLRDSIRIERVSPSYHLHRVVRVRAGGYVTNPRTRRLVDYAAIQERKHGFMRRAWEQVSGTVAEMIKRKIVEKVNE